MHCEEEIERLKAQYTDKYVKVDASRPELARFGQAYGQIKTINFSGRVLVQFEGADRAWYDLALDAFTIVDPPPPPPTPAAPAAQPAPAEKPAP